MIRHMDAKRFPEAFKTALDGVTYCETLRSRFGFHHLYWWIFLEIPARSAHELGEDERQQVDKLRRRRGRQPSVRAGEDQRHRSRSLLQRESRS